MVKYNIPLFVFLMILYCQLEAGESEIIQPQVKSAYKSYDLDSVRGIARRIAQKAFHLKLVEPYSPMTFTNMGAGDDYYALYETLLVRKFNLATNEFIAEWRLGDYPDLKIEDEAIKQGVFFSYGYVGGEGVGCLLTHPLRYGDLNGDKKNELIIFFDGKGQKQDEMVIFSTDLKKVIFANVIFIDRAVESNPEALVDIYPGWNVSSDYQYSYEDGRNPPLFSIGYRSFGKLFFGDVNDDGKQDIILWRKYFESLLNGDIKKGFAKKDELFVHYSLVDGEYKKQSTAADTIKGWLAAKQLSWQQGFPSRSECPGQEGQLIPELHDPLLNDPDVLH